MTETAPEAPEADGAADTSDEQIPDWVKTKLEKANREAASLRGRLRETEPLARRARELEEATKTDVQRLTEAQEAAERRAAQAEGALLRMRVAAARNLPTELADRLRGDTEDELLEDADRVLALLTPRQTPPVSFDGGPRGVQETPGDFNTAFRRIAGK